MAATSNGRGDLGAACVAVAVLAILVLLLGWHPVVAAPLSVAAYLGVRFLHIPSFWRDLRWPNPRWWGRWPANDIRDATVEEQAYARSFDHARTLRELTPQFADPQVRTEVASILDRIDQILKVMGDDQDLSQIPVLDTCLLEPLGELLSTYLRLSRRGVQSGSEVLARIEMHDLPLIRAAVDDFYERQHSRQLTDLATLSELMEFNLESVRAMTRRRTTP